LNSIICAEEASWVMRHSKKGTRAPAQEGREGGREGGKEEEN
jgi:hypothetical protein